MASRPTRDIPPVKEKRGTSPSNIPSNARTTTQRGQSPNPPKKPVSPARTNDPSSSEKPIPNYLKSTLSSAPDPSKQQGKKSVSKFESTHKPTLLRRRSFDKPPSTSQSQRSRVSPIPTLRSSSSFSGKTVSPQKGFPDKNLKIPKDAGKQHTLYARPVNTTKKSGTYVKKHEIVNEKAVSRPKIIENVNVSEVSEPEMQVDDQELGVAPDEEEIIQNGDNVEKGVKDSCLEDQEPISYEQIEGDNAQDFEPSIISDTAVEAEKMEIAGAGENKEEKISTFESFTILEHQEPVKTEETEGKSEKYKDTKIATTTESSTVEDTPVDDQEPIIDSKQTEGNHENRDAKIAYFESSDQNSELQIPESETVEPSAVNEDQDVTIGVDTEETKQEELKEDTTTEMNNMINSGESVAVNNNDSEDVEEKQQEEEREEEEAQEVSVEKKPVVVNEGARVQMAHGKKDIAVSNDVIEETANKLRGQRKNKVRALAGAFETVISLQDPK